jgi:hypothetical protein
MGDPFRLYLNTSQGTLGFAKQSILWYNSPNGEYMAFQLLWLEIDLHETSCSGLGSVF